MLELLVLQIQLKLNDVDITEDATVTSTYVEYQPQTDLAYSTYTIYLEVKDNSGNKATKQWSFTIISDTNIIEDTIAVILAEEPTTWINTEQENAIGSISITASTNLENVTITVNTTGIKPEEVTLPAETVYMYMVIETDATDDITNAIINFKIEKQWINTNNIDISSIKLMRYSDEGWETLETNQTGEDSIYIYFEAETAGFSTFAITGVETVEEPEEIPWILVIIGMVIAGIMAILILLFKSGFLYLERQKPPKNKR